MQRRKTSGTVPWTRVLRNFSYDGVSYSSHGTHGSDVPVAWWTNVGGEWSQIDEEQYQQALAARRAEVGDVSRTNEFTGTKESIVSQHNWMMAEATADKTEVEAKMRAEAAIFYRRLAQVVKDHPEEIVRQATDRASLAATQYAPFQREAKVAYFDAVTHHAKVDGIKVAFEVEAAPEVEVVGSVKVAGESVEVSVIPDCDICKSEGTTTPAYADARLAALGGMWANVCQMHFDAFGGSLGTGSGQAYVKAASAPGEDPDFDATMYEWGYEVGQKIRNGEDVPSGGVVPGQEDSDLPFPSGVRDGKAGNPKAMTAKVSALSDADKQKVMNPGAIELTREDVAAGLAMPSGSRPRIYAYYVPNPGEGSPQIVSVNSTQRLEEMGQKGVLEVFWTTSNSMDNIGDWMISRASVKTSARIDTLRDIVDSHRGGKAPQSDKVDGVKVDPQTANMLVTLYDALGEGAKAKFDQIELMKLINFGWSKVSSAKTAEWGERNFGRSLFDEDDYDEDEDDSNVEQIARDILAENGEPDPHPALLADTISEVEYQMTNNAAFRTLAQASLKEADVPAYVKDLDGDEAYEVGREDGKDAEKTSEPYAEGFSDEVEGKPNDAEYWRNHSSRKVAAFAPTHTYDGIPVRLVAVGGSVVPSALIEFEDGTSDWAPPADLIPLDAQRV